MLAARTRFMFVLVLALVALAPPSSGETYDAGLQAYEAGDFKAAFDLWRPLAVSGDPVAQYSLGKLLERGGGEVAQDLTQAARWYQAAARQGIAASQNNLALMYAQGRGVERDLPRAIDLWLDAAKQDHPMAQYNLGLAYFRGEGLQKDEHEAAGWFRRAADSGLGDAQYAMGQMNRLGLILPKDQGKALYWYSKAADQGHREARSQVQLLEAADVVASDPGAPSVTPASLAGEAARPAEPTTSAALALGAQTSQGSMLDGVTLPVESKSAAAPERSAGQQDQPLAQSVGALATGAGSETPAKAGELAPRRKPAVPQLAMQQVAAVAPAKSESIAASEPNQAEEQAAPRVAQATDDQDQSAAPSTGKRRGVQVWLASERSEQAAEQLWPDAKQKYPELLAKAKPEIVRVDLGGTVFYRLMVGPLKSPDAARDLCALMRLQDEDAFCKLLP